MIGRTPAHIRATRPLRHGVIADFEMAEADAAPLHRAGRRFEIPHQRDRLRPERDHSRRARRASRRRRSLPAPRQAFLIEEPLAAAIGAGLPVGEPVGSLIVDIGGGTSEMAVTALGGLVVSQSIRVGGYELDEAIVRSLEPTAAPDRAGAGRALKLEIGSRCRTPSSSADVAGRDRSPACCAALSVGETCGWRSSGRSRRSSTLSATLEQTPPELASDVASRGLTLVGEARCSAGSTAGSRARRASR